VGIAEGIRCVIMGVNEITELSLRSLANTYRCVNEDLGRSADPSIGTIASVMSLAMHESLFGMVGKTRMHLQALERMVELKGGLEAFEYHTTLLQKVCR
jgi:hypothetical protein